MTVDLGITGLGKTFIKGREAFTAVRGVSLHVAAGELVTFLGPSGCGKTTILRMVAGFETPSEGRIAVGGQDMTALPVHMRGIGFVFQNYALFPHMSIFANVAYGLRAAKTAENEVKRRVGEALELVGLHRVENRFPNQLSGGEQQRVALARVLVLQPKLLLMDEPLSNLDAKLRLHMRTEIRRIQQHLEITCLYVTHDQKEALTLSDRVMVVNKGQVEQIGTPFDLYANPKSLFVADFIGQANILPAVITSISGDRAGTDLLGKSFSFRFVPDSGPRRTGKGAVVLRPENILLTPHGAGRLDATVRNRFFVGDHMEYDLSLAGGQTISAFVPYGPGMDLFDVAQQVGLDFTDHAPVVLFQEVPPENGGEREAV
jgi:iron(III) transport system ATP-binding protein